LEPVKILIYVAVFVLLIVIARALARSSEIRGGMPGGMSSVPQSHPVDSPMPEPAPLDDGKKRSPASGRELGFPIRLPAITRDADGKFNRPEFLNYYFSKIDLVTGPPDPDSFFDELYLQARDPASGHTWTYEYTVASPSGLSEIMRTERFESLYFEAPVLIVARWDLKVILQTVSEEIMKGYGRTGLSEDVPQQSPIQEHIL
jgi:hypothetical protein